MKNIFKGKYISLTAVLSLIGLLSHSQNPLQHGFLNPPDSLRPSCYWYWLNDNISPEGVVKDVETMSKVGIGRAFIGNIGLGVDEVPYGNVKMFSDGWWKTIHAAFGAAAKKNISLGLFNGPGWSQSGGPWVKPTQTMRYISGKEIIVEGPKKFSEKLADPGENFQDVALLAFPQTASDKDMISGYKPQISTDASIDNLQNAFDGDTATAAVFPTAINNESVINIDITTDQAYTARSLSVYPMSKPLLAKMTLQTVDEAGDFKTIKEFEFNRINPARNVGFMPYSPVIVTFPQTASKHFRLVVSNIEGKSGIAEIQLSAAAKVERVIEKQLGKMFATPLPLWNEYQWPVQSETTDKDLVIDPSKVMDITSHLSADGKLSWDIPAGKWVIMRYGMVPTGVTNAPATPEGQGYEVDKMNKNVLENHFDSFVGMIQNKLTPEEKKSLKWVVADSYETGSQNWTDGMAAAFKKVYGYDPLPWMPVLSGRVVGTENQSDRFLWDLRRFVADRVSYQYVGGLRDISNKHGLKLWLENYGHWGFPGEFLQYGGQSDEVGGEFWNEGTLGSIECKAASSSAHIYGKKKVAAESFTAGGLTYMRYPALLKKRADWSFTEGINSTLLHVMIEQPTEDKQPGINAWFGTEFNRHNSWFSEAKSFFDYLKRSNYLLQQGLPVNDVAYFIGEDAPKMTGIRDPSLPKGYMFDYINAEVILKRLTVKNGRFVLPDGMSYKVLVLPKLETMRPELLQKIKQLVEAGGTIVGPAPLRSPSLQDYPTADNTVKSLAENVWGSVDNKTMHGNLGKGSVINGMNMEQAFGFLKLDPDFDSNTSDTVLYIHRTTVNGEIYFVTNQTNKDLDFAPEFRVKNKQPELWDAVNATTRVLQEFRQTENGTIVPLKLAPYESAFIIFNNVPKAGSTHNKNFVSSTELRRLTGSWMVQFDEGSGGPSKAVEFDGLQDWTKRPEENIKSYSGAAIYRTSFNFSETKPGERIYLDLGKVSVMATVTLNDKKIGTVWTAPWRIDVTKAIKSGENKLEIKVVNTLVNRMIGDRKKPEAERKVWSNVDPFSAESMYQSSGLMGPVTIQGEVNDSLGTMRYLMNDKIKVGIDMNLGGAITYFSSNKDNDNMINNWDWGRQVQMSFYSGPVPFEPDGKKANKSWTFIGWNPIQSGDVAGNRSKVLEYKNNGREIYVKCIPMHWPLDNVPGECTYESWITMDGNAAKVRSRIVNNRPDHKQYPARGQELPAVYTNAPYHKLITYKGDKPYTGDAIVSVDRQNIPGDKDIRWESWQATESWAANLNDKGIGLGVYNPGVQGFSGGYYGDSTFVGGSKNIPTAYIAPNSMDILDYNIDYDYNYVLIAGSADDIRKYVYGHKNVHLPMYDFSSSRQQWVYENTTDAGWPIKNGLNITLAENATAVGPVEFWSAKDGSTVEIKGAWPAGAKQARIYWRAFNEKNFSEQKSILFDISGDGQEHTYNVKLSGSKEYNGNIAQLKLLLSDNKATGTVTLKSIKMINE